MASLVACHLVDAVMKSIETHLFALLGKFGLACAGAVLSSYACLEVCLGGSGNDFTEHLCITGSMISFFESSLAIESADFGITLTDGGSGHSQIHTDFAALACEFSAKEFLHVFAQVESDADLVLGSPSEFCCLVDGLKFGFGLLA